VLPVEYMPRAAQAVAFLMPNRHYNTIVRGIMLVSGRHVPQVLTLGLIGLGLWPTG
jgi:hypothetical protein